ncbi:DUF6069 family protein [Microbacterium sp. RD1]|uniref:DUF6069 family protein n=1 Tax=Microbacterium sp. RD1 TaxID=3457313 RepID=UPI003FA5C3E7
MSTSVVRPRTTAVVLFVFSGVVASAIFTSALAFAALALGADAAFIPLQPGPYLTFGIAGFLVGLAGWVLVVRFARRSARVLRVLVPVLVLLTLVPDVVLLLTGFLPGTTGIGVAALMLMHVLVAATAVFIGQRISPAR